jgi:hypothetical protein
MTSSINNDALIQNINNIINDKITQILISISEKYDIEKDELFDCYLNMNNTLSSTTNIVTEKKKRNKNIKPKEDICIAKKADGMQCTRKKRDNSLYCGKHCNNQKFGSVSMEDSVTEDSEKYIMTWTEQYDGVNYLVDNNNIVYSYDIENPVIIGKKSKDGKLVLLNKVIQS